MDLVVFAGIALGVGLLGLVAGLAVAPRLSAWDDRRAAGAGPEGGAGEGGGPDEKPGSGGPGGESDSSGGGGDGD